MLELCIGCGKQVSATGFCRGCQKDYSLRCPQGWEEGRAACKALRYDGPCSDDAYIFEFSESEKKDFEVACEVCFCGEGALSGALRRSPARPFASGSLGGASTTGVASHGAHAAATGELASKQGVENGPLRF
ncbi:unnamed protein product [Effrenium voratum]|nr:unnamed protein product [Effrenium voratum]